MTALDGTRPLDPDALAALEEQRDFLLRSLQDLEREHDAGDVDDHDYTSLKDDYTARAARSIRAIQTHHARMARARPPRPWPRTLAVLAAVVAFAVVAGVLVARFSGRRQAGDALTGDIRESTRTQLDNARLALQQERYHDAIKIYDAVLTDQPTNIEAMAYKGRAQIGNGDMDGVLTLIDAAETNPDYPALLAATKSALLANCRFGASRIAVRRAIAVVRYADALSPARSADLALSPRCDGPTFWRDDLYSPSGAFRVSGECARSADV